ncbi:MAG: sulfate adenylyltransferase subunit CysD [Candidatus Woesearchaeota archaeon]
MLKNNEEKSIFILREAYRNFRNCAVLWSGGKDSTVILWLCKKAFFGKIPFKVVHIDTGKKLKEIYDYRDLIAKKFKLDLIIAKSDTKRRYKNRLECCNSLKTEALKKAVREYGFDALIVGIRRDEHGIRAKERFFSPRNKRFEWGICFNDKSGQDAEFPEWNIFATDFGQGVDHVRVHPLLHWTETDIWRYIEMESVPVCNLYFAKNGKRYRSVGCKTCCGTISSSARNAREIVQELKRLKTGERYLRAQDKEWENMQMLRSIGYM